jgi:hypothetical protein
MTVAASSRTAEEVSVSRNAWSGCATRRATVRLDRDQVGRTLSEGDE